MADSQPSHARTVPVIGASLGALGAAGTAIAASLCCVGPVVVALLGTGGAIAVAKLEPWRPYLLGLGVVILGIAFWLAYRSGGVCRDGSCTKRTSRFVKFSLWTSAAVLLASFALPYIVY